MLRKLEKIKEICDKEGFRYVLTWGTLIGAIRHKGFIPWDDDIDIMMPRPDHDKLMKYMSEHKDELKPLEVFNNDTCPNYPYMLTRISDSRYILDVIGNLCLRCGSDRIHRWDMHTCPKCGGKMQPTGEEEFWT